VISIAHELDKLQKNAKSLINCIMKEEENRKTEISEDKIQTRETEINNN
jgi:hypothetical protein